MRPVIDANVSGIMTQVHVVEFSTVGKRGDINTRPMNGVWLPDSQRIVLTTPIAYPQKAFNVRRNNRVAVFYSDPTGSGLEDAPTVLIQGTGAAPDVVTTPQDVPEFWRGAFQKSPPPPDQFLDPHYQDTMDWFFWRLVITVRPDQVHLAQPTQTGGAWRPPAPVGAALRDHITDAVGRYPTAVFTTRDQRGYPYLARATVVTLTAPGPTRCRVRPMQPFAGVGGPASLLWHRHNGRFAEASDLLVSGSARQTGDTWEFTPERIPGHISGNHDTGSPSTGSPDTWITDARQRSAHYLQRRQLLPPVVDWTALANYAATV